ncbi:ABC transporter ATP-binding protein [Anoxybacterium hadale]|uniref:ABC transporter ATP-binding protein n=1 Tax=Anoxybacterium hadale TaxID=3408580 RepID=A0ACD1AEN8_9FIRM|nr:ABC transporter ATP-binding protein [Clostridiales bacterium]
MKSVVFEDVSFQYGNLDQPTLHHIDLVINEGEKVLITGKSGSGKSTLAHCINGLIPFTYKGEMSGRVLVNQKEPKELSLFAMGTQVGSILQDQDCQFVGLSAGEDVAFALENDCISAEEMHTAADRALEQVDMLQHKNQPPQSLSGGQKQKVAIAGILAMNVPILLFDEPLANLDPASGKKAMETILDIHGKTGKTIIVIEHRIEDVLEHGFDRVVVVDDGRIVFNGTPDLLLAEDILPRYGLRQPLYVEMLKLCGIKAKEEDRISVLENTIKYKDQVLKKYMEDRFADQRPDHRTILKLQGVSFRYFKEDPYTIEDVSFDVKEGEMLAIVGNNGAGKSTLLKAISGIVKYQEGSIYYGDKNSEDKKDDKGSSILGMNCINSWTAKQRALAIGFVMQNPNHMITKDMIYDEVAFGLRNFGVDQAETDARVKEALKICGLYEYRNWPVSSLSYGQKKRVTIASILSMGPKVIILDEPTAGQDYTSYREFMSYLDQIKNTGVGIILITHDMHLALEYADTGVVLSSGRVIAKDYMDRILADSWIIGKANLKHTSIERMGRLFGVEDLSSFIAYFTRRVTSATNPGPGMTESMKRRTPGEGEEVPHE